MSNVGPTSECVAQEIFGPVLAMQTFRSPEEVCCCFFYKKKTNQFFLLFFYFSIKAIALANNTFFGLAGSVWTENISLALEVAISIKAVHIF